MHLPRLAPLALGLLALGALAPASAGADEAGAAAAAAEARAKQQAEALVERLQSKDAAVQREAVLEAKAEQHPLVTAALVKRLSDEHSLVRQGAIEALAARTTSDGKKQAAGGLGARLARLAAPEHQAELLLALGALQTLAQVVSLKAIGDGIETKTPEKELEARLQAIAHVPDAKAIELLIDLRARAGNRAANEENRAAALCRRALAFALGRDMGSDTDAWRSWWKDNAETFDFTAVARARAEEAERRAQREAKKAEREAKRPK